MKCFSLRITVRRYLVKIVVSSFLLFTNVLILSAQKTPKAVFVIADGKPIHVLKSIQWCRKSVDQCWKMKQANIRAEEQAAAKDAYDKANKVYEQMIEEASKEK